MGSIPTDGGTPVDIVPAFIVAFGGGVGRLGPGKVEVTNVDDRCVLTIGRTWVVLDRDQLADLLHALAVAEHQHDLAHRPRRELTPAEAHAKELVESLDLEWPR